VSFYHSPTSHLQQRADKKQVSTSTEKYSLQTSTADPKARNPNGPSHATEQAATLLDSSLKARSSRVWRR